METPEEVGFFHDTGSIIGARLIFVKEANGGERSAASVAPTYGLKIIRPTRRLT